MAYSNQQVPLDPKHFPPPQTWTLWVEHRNWQDRSARTGVGKLRHFHTLAAAKKSMAWIGSKSKYHKTPGCFSTDWSILEWVDGGWVERYSGLAGESRDSNPLYQRRLTKDERVDPMKQVGENVALESILESIARKVS